ncbi:molybdenum cofactor biosynthesis protein MoaE [Maricaulis parjimensis]|uniref:molybdenum cofactor biosynthesis protein MoaE n=1 Tax=Maricaulis parjimensis TaxID=144023 RepID=UPI00193AB684|nr:molybdenum cofactor biosynthesis protein MoaE [Maricaulis parjimensis]
MARITVTVSSFPIACGDLLDRLAGDDADCGGVASFTGQVRAEPGLVALELEHYPGVTEDALTRIARSAADQWSLHQAIIHHRVGRMELGEVIVFVAASAPHRRAALDATAYMIDMLKTDAPFWKRVHTQAGSHWVEARDTDREAAAFWTDTLASEDA